MFMYLLGLVLLGLVIYALFLRKRGGGTQGANNRLTAGSKRGGIAIHNPIPKGFQIYAQGIPVAGLQHRKPEALRFAQSSNHELTLEREPSNPQDPNAIRLIGKSNGKAYFIGYLPREISQQIIVTGLFDSVKARLTRIYIGKNTYLDFQYQIIGPKVEKTRFDEFLKIRPANSAQKEYLKFFGLQIASDMTSGQAEEAIEKHQKVSEEGEQEQWLGYASILDDFADSDFRDCHELKKVPKTVLLAAIDQLRQEGKTYTYLGDNIEELVDRVLKIRPELQKSA